MLKRFSTIWSSSSSHSARSYDTPPSSPASESDCGNTCHSTPLPPSQEKKETLAQAPHETSVIQDYTDTECFDDSVPIMSYNYQPQPSMILRYNSKREPKRIDQQRRMSMSRSMKRSMQSLFTHHSLTKSTSTLFNKKSKTSLDTAILPSDNQLSLAVNKPLPPQRTSTAPGPPPQPPPPSSLPPSLPQIDWQPTLPTATSSQRLYVVENKDSFTPPQAKPVNEPALQRDLSDQWKVIDNTDCTIFQHLSECGLVHMAVRDVKILGVELILNPGHRDAFSGCPGIEWVLQAAFGCLIDLQLFELCAQINTDRLPVLLMELLSSALTKNIKLDVRNYWFKLSNLVLFEDLQVLSIHIGKQRHGEKDDRAVHSQLDDLFRTRIPVTNNLKRLEISSGSSRAFATAVLKRFLAPATKLEVLQLDTPIKHNCTACTDWLAPSVKRLKIGKYYSSHGLVCHDNVLTLEISDVHALQFMRFTNLSNLVLTAMGQSSTYIASILSDALPLMPNLQYLEFKNMHLNVIERCLDGCILDTSTALAVTSPATTALTPSILYNFVQQIPRPEKLIIDLLQVTDLGLQQTLTQLLKIQPYACYAAVQQYQVHSCFHQQHTESLVLTHSYPLSIPNLYLVT